MNKEYKRDESCIKKASAWIIGMNFLCMLLMILSVCCLLFITNLYIKIICSFIFVIAWLFGIYSDMEYDYRSNFTIIFTDNLITCKYELDKNVVPTSNTTVICNISNISKIKVKKNRVVVYGDITIKRPLKKENKISKFEIPLGYGISNDEVLYKLKYFKKVEVK